MNSYWNSAYICIINDGEEFNAMSDRVNICNAISELIVVGEKLQRGVTFKNEYHEVTQSCIL